MPESELTEPQLPAQPFVSCAMYAFDEPVKEAWRRLFEPLAELLSEDPAPGPQLEVSFADSETAFLSPDMWLGHTCGFPLVKKWHQHVLPVSVPLFDIPGCVGPNYRSWLVCRHQDTRQQLIDFQGTRAAINNRDSNSGMNVFRHAVDELMEQSNIRQPFFREVLVTGSHAASLEAVAADQADIAAIDVVSYHHLIRLDPSLAQRTRIVTSTIQTTGLPFVVPRAGTEEAPEIVARRYTAALNQCRERLPRKMLKMLRLEGFKIVTMSNYAHIAGLDQVALNRTNSTFRTLL